MWPRNGRSALLWIGAWMLALVALAGCAEVQVVDTTPAASTPEAFASPLAAPGERHNLAILAVDFDPPLDYQQLILRRQSVSLLVAVENSGTGTERSVVVQAQLSTPEDPNLLLSQEAEAASIAPGQIQVVRFTRLGEIPYHHTYHLEVMVRPVAGEESLDDNRKAFDIQIHQNEGRP